MSQSDEILLEAREALARVQEFDPSSLVRKEVLGKYAFYSAVEPTRKLVQLFCSLSQSNLAYFPDQQLSSVKDLANSTYSIIKKIEDFDVENAQPTVSDAQQSIVSNLESHFQHSFNVLAPLISFAAARSQDFAALERDARSATQAAQDQAAKILESLSEQRDAATRIIQEVRAAAAEQGVGNQALHFQSEAQQHADQAKNWLKFTVGTSIGLAVFAVLSLFIHRIPILTPTSSYETIQLGISKFLIFTVIAYMLLLCARNYLSHKHNEVVNRHRQNALATFTALVDAAGDQVNSDIVLTQASACIFSPQETGYTKQEGAKSELQSILQIMPKLNGQPPASQTGLV